VERKLKPSSVKTYLSSLVKLHKLKGFADFKIEDSMTPANLAMCSPNLPSMKCRVMTLNILRLLSHQLASTGWLKNTRQTVWAACKAGFFSSARMGELLAPHETKLDPTATHLVLSTIQ
jgi:hypothetical protein